MNGFATLLKFSAVALLGLALVLLAGCEPLTSTEQPQPETSTSMAASQTESTVASASTTMSQAGSTPATAGPTTTAGAGATPSATTTTTLPKPTPAQPLVTTTSLMLTEITMVTLPADPWVRYEENDPNIAWGGSWMTMATPDASGGTFRTVSDKASCRVSFQGTGIRFVFMFGPDKGIAKVTLDNADVLLVGLYFPSVWSMDSGASATLPFGNHTALVEWTGKSDSPSTGNAIAIDAVEVKGTLVK